MVEKRALIFVTLAMFVWAVLISSLAGYLYLQNTMNTEQIAENRQSLNTMTTTYNEAMTKYDNLISDYSAFYGIYSFPQGANFTIITNSFGNFLAGLGGNFTSLLSSQKDLNETYNTLQSECQTLWEGGNVTKEEFGELLNAYYELLNLLSIRELSKAISEISKLSINICISYGNETVEWRNETSMSPGSSLFQATQKVATVNYTYSAWMKPGHIRLTAINDKAEEYTQYEGWSWIWSYWDSNQQNWVSGPVGCDAWMLKDGGVYKWEYKYWNWSP